MNGTMMNYPLTLVPILERAGKLFGRVEIVSRRPDKSLHRYTYGDFYRRARALAEVLQKAGLRPGDRVATLMWNHYAHLEAYFAVPVAGGVVHTLNLRLHPADLAYIINHAQDRFLIVDDLLLPLYEKLKDKVSLERVMVVPVTGGALAPNYENYEAFLAGADGQFHYPALDENQGAGLCFTSGTTGKPKGVVYSHRALVLHTLALALSDTLGIGQHDVTLAVVPMFHANAWGLPYAATLIGAKQVFPGPHLDAKSLLELFESERVTVSAGVPTVMLSILEALQADPGQWNLARGMRILVGGSAAPESMIRRFDTLGLRVFHAWGMTETTPLGTVCTLKRYMEDWPDETKYEVRAKQGLPAPFMEVRAVNDAGEVPRDGKTRGELQVRGPWVAASYFNLSEEQGRWTPDGWFCTGDVVTIDAEGYVKIADRTKDLIKSGGEWISSVELETTLMGHPAVKEAAVIAAPHPKWLERPLAVVVLKDGAAATAEELRQFLSPRFAKWWLPDAFVFTDQIPRTSAGKFMKSTLREQFGHWRWDT